MKGQQGAYPVNKILKPLACFLEQILFPAKCLKCGVYIRPANQGLSPFATCFCSACCQKGVTPVEPPFCTICGKLFRTRSGGNHLCESCIQKPSFIGKVRACVVYDGIMKDAVPLLKYSGKLSLLKSLEPMMIKGYTDHFSENDIDIVLPMPLHKKKVMQRGFNQAYLLVRSLQKLACRAKGVQPAWKMDLTSLVRVKMTAPQTGLDMKARRSNLKNAFEVKHPGKVKGRYILLIDDVFTTGATANEAAKTLLKAGARRVDALVLARA